MMFSKGVRVKHRIYGVGIIVKYHVYDLSYDVLFRYPFGLMEIYEDELEEIM